MDDFPSYDSSQIIYAKFIQHLLYSMVKIVLNDTYTPDISFSFSILVSLPFQILLSIQVPYDTSVCIHVRNSITLVKLF